MTLLQLRLVIAIAETKSVTAAANELKISQPNASNSLKLLEDEIGFPIFLRSKAGATLTPKGIKFLSYARQMQDASEKVMELQKEEEVYRLRLGTVNYYAAAEPFFAICADHREDLKADFCYISVSIQEGVRELISRNLDVVAAPVMRHQVTGLLSECEKGDIKAIFICKIPSIMMMRKGHPAAGNEQCRNMTLGCDTMKDYPYVGLRNLAEDSSSTGYSDSDFAQCSYKIFADDTNARLRIIEATNGFGFGLLSSYRMMGQFGLISFPVPDVVLELFCLIRTGEADRKEIQDYLNRLKTEMKRMLISQQYGNG